MYPSGINQFCSAGMFRHAPKGLSRISIKVWQDQSNCPIFERESQHDDDRAVMVQTTKK